MECQWPPCRQHAPEGKKYCFLHGRNEPKESKKAEPIAKRSDKRKQEDKELRKIFKERFAANKECQIKIPGVCTGRAECLDHIQKTSPKNRLLPENLIMACFACNGAKEQEKGQKFAKENGLHISRFKKSP